jgi:hypothetical protein
MGDDMAKAQPTVAFWYLAYEGGPPEIQVSIGLEKPASVVVANHPEYNEAWEHSFLEIRYPESVAKKPLPGVTVSRAWHGLYAMQGLALQIEPDPVVDVPIYVSILQDGAIVRAVSFGGKTLNKSDGVFTPYLTMYAQGTKQHRIINVGYN